MLPAHQRLHADEMKVANVNLRLVLHKKFRTLQTRPQIAFEHELFESARGAARGVEVKIAATLHLGAIEGDARSLQQPRSVTTILRIHTDPDTARHEDLLIFEDECLIECLLDRARDVRRILSAWNVREQHCEFITAETRDCIAFTNTTGQTLGH